MSDIIVRTARIEEIETLLQFEQLIIEYERPFVENMTTEYFNYYCLEELISSDDSEVLVAELNGEFNSELIGSGYAKIKKSVNYLTNEFHAFLGYMYVDPRYRRQGINQLIINRLINWSKSRGMDEIRLTVFSENDSAIKAYKKSGFSEQITEMRMNIK